MSWRAVDPSPFRGWIRWAPRSWPAAPLARLDLVTHRLAWPGEDSAGGAEAPETPPDDPDLVYLPPVAPDRRERIEALAVELAAAGSASARHETDGAGPGGGASTARWVDLLAAWLAQKTPRAWREALSGIPAPIDVAVPLVGGLTPPAGEALDAWLDVLIELAPRSVVGVTAELTPGDRRRLVERLGEASFEAVFHATPMSERDFARRVAARGLRPLPARPAIPGLPPRTARNRELAAALWEAAELGLRLAAPESECAALFAAARHVDSTALDVAALGREGNLAVLGWLAPAARALVEELLTTGASGRLAELRREWSGGLSA